MARNSSYARSAISVGVGNTSGGDWRVRGTRGVRGGRREDPKNGPSVITSSLADDRVVAELLVFFALELVVGRLRFAVRALLEQWRQLVVMFVRHGILPRSPINAWCGNGRATHTVGQLRVTSCAAVC